MNREQILSAIRELGFAQGFYGRLYNYLRSGSEESEKALNQLVSMKFKDVVDMVMFIEQ